MSKALRPKLRWPLDLQPVEHNGERYVVFRDRSGIAEQPAVLPAALMAVITQFDGEKSVDQIAAELSIYGVGSELIVKLASELDSFYLLDNARSQERWTAIQEAYRALPIRPAAFAGAVYPAGGAELRQELDSYAAKAAPVPTDRLSRASKMTAMTSPHIDYRRGWHAYATGAAALQQAPAPDYIFLIGTSHQASRGIFHLSRKGFETPLGQLNPAVEVIEDLARLFGQRSFAEEILHRSEHSLELQVPFIQRRFQAETAANRGPQLIPILVGSFHNYLQEGIYPDDGGEARDFIGAWTEVLKNLTLSGKRFLIFGGIDLAHVGRHFGDRIKVSDGGLPGIEQRDRQLLDAVLSADERKLFNHIAEDMDARRICGFPTLYSMLAALKKSGQALQGDLIEYRQAVDPATDCIVTFASAYWSAV